MRVAPEFIVEGPPLTNLVACSECLCSVDDHNFSLPIDCTLISVKRVSPSDLERLPFHPRRDVLFSQVFVWISRNQLLVEITQRVGAIISSYVDHAIFNRLSLGMLCERVRRSGCLEIDVCVQCIAGRTPGSSSSNALAFVWIIDTST